MPPARLKQLLITAIVNKNHFPLRHKIKFDLTYNDNENKTYL